MPKQYLTVKEVAKLFGVTPLTVRSWDARGKLAAYRHPVNNYRLYKVEDVENLMKDLEGSKGVARQKIVSGVREAIAEEPPKPKGPRKLEIDLL